MAHLPKQALLDYYQRYADAFAEVGFVQNETAFLEQMRKIKNRGIIILVVNLILKLQVCLYQLNSLLKNRP